MPANQEVCEMTRQCALIMAHEDTILLSSIGQQFRIFESKNSRFHSSYDVYLRSLSRNPVTIAGSKFSSAKKRT